MRQYADYFIMKDHGLSTATFTAATTDIITSNAHGLQNGDMIMVSSATTLPGGLSASTVYWVRDVATNTFKLSPTPNIDGGGPIVDITSAGTGTHTWIEHDIGNNIFCEDFQHAIVSVSTGSSANMTLKFVGSIGDSTTSPNDCPDFSASQSQTNVWDYLEVIDLEDGSSIDGDTGISFAGSDDTRQFEVNINAIRWLNVILTAWSAGDVTVQVRLYND